MRGDVCAYVYLRTFMRTCAGVYVGPTCVRARVRTRVRACEGVHVRERLRVCAVTRTCVRA